MIWTIAVVVGSLLITIWAIKDIIEWNRQINYIADVVIPMRYKKEKQPKWLPYSETEGKEYTCSNCMQPCTKEEFEHGFCLDCDQLELFNDFEEYK